jgi:hypothetical protein
MVGSTPTFPTTFMRKIFPLIVTLSLFVSAFSFAQPNKFLNHTKDRICIQVITPAKNPITGECKEFPTPCNVPPGWQKVESCSGSIITIEPEESFKKPIVCKEYFWYNEQNLECQGPKTFCGSFMYKGLYVFEKKEDCEKSLKENPKFREKKKEEVKKEIKEKNEILLDDISKIVNKINFEPASVEIDGEKISFKTEKIFTKKVGEREIKILVQPEKVMIKEGEKFAEVEGKLSFENEKLLIEGKEINLAPSQVIEKLGIENPLDLEMKLKLEGNTPVWWTKFVQEKKILRIFPIKIQKEIEISAQKEKIEKLKEVRKLLLNFPFLNLKF